MSFLVVFLCFVVRAFARAYVQQLNGVKVDEICIGYPIRFLTLSFHFRGTRVRLSPVLFCSPDLPKTDLSLKQKLDIAGTGILACVAWAMLMLFLITPLVWWRLILALILLALWYFRRAINVYVLPVFAVLLGGVMAVLLVLALVNIGNLGSAMTQVYAPAHPVERNLVRQIFDGAGKCLLLAFVNLVPVYKKLDGWRMAAALVQAWRKRPLLELCKKQELELTEELQQR